MKPEYVKGNVRANCPDCKGARTTFEFNHSGHEFGFVILDGSHEFQGQQWNRVLYVLTRCAGCGRGGVAKIHDNGQVFNGELEEFYPVSIEFAQIPEEVPPEIVKEYREAEICMAHGAHRASTALFRSTLEKTLKVNGYSKNTLEAKIDEAADDGILTVPLRKKAHEDIRVLGNDVLHDEWREVTYDEVEAAHHYTQRILEGFYDERSSVEATLIQKGRINNV